MHKVMHVITGLNKGGAETMLLKLLKEWRDKEVCHCVVSLIDKGTLGGEIEQLGVTVYSLNLKNNKNIASLFISLRKILAKEDPDLIQGWMYHGNLLSLLFRVISKKNIPIIWNVRHSIAKLNKEAFFTQLVIRLNAFFSSKVILVIYNSMISIQQHANLGFSKENSIYIPNGFDTKKFSNDSNAGLAVRESLNIGSDSFVVGSIARFHPMKNHKMIVDAAYILLSKGYDIHFIFVGRGVSYDSLCIESKHAKNFHFFGEITDVSNIINAMDVYISSSSWGEGFPNVIGEAMASQVPCVVTDVGESYSIVGDTGFLISINNTGELVSSVVQMSLDCKKRVILGKQARERVVRNFSIEYIADKYEDIYNKHFVV
jgi:glycosyltransferase involved in cell wall biosynthesis